MTEVIGDLVMPSEIIIAKYEGENTTGAKLGSLKVSGSKLQFHNGTDWEVVTSA